MNGSELIYEPKLGASASKAGYQFLLRFWQPIVAISFALVIPCFWHPHIEAGDLPSHLYNAWLAQLIAKGQLPGLFVVRQWNNVFFDLALNGLAGLLGLNIAEKVAVSAAVLVFFWGSFALVSNISQVRDNRTIPWVLVPCLAAVSYGYTFEMGFVNYYISIGLTFWGLAILARPTSSFLSDAIVVLLLAALTWLAHPLGLCVFASAGAYIVFAKSLGPRLHVLLFFAAVLVLAFVYFDIRVHHRSFPYPSDFGGLIPNGADQLWVYGQHGLVSVYLVTGLFLAAVLVDAEQRWRTTEWRINYSLPLQLYVLALLAIALIPSGIKTPHRLGGTVLGFVKERLTIVAAVFACCILAQVKPRKWLYAGFAALAMIFFTHLYFETRKISLMEDQLDRLVATLPQGRRVTKKMFYLSNTRATIDHITDRACIGRCFAYDNYEPSSGQFRIRALPDNSFVLTGADSLAAHKGQFVVREQDLPLTVVYQCVPDTATLCLGELMAGQENGDVGRSKRLSSTF